jgi:hypothetical protein
MQVIVYKNRKSARLHHGLCNLGQSVDILPPNCTTLAHFSRVNHSLPEG